jgi:hypothetical protein
MFFLQNSAYFTPLKNHKTTRKTPAMKSGNREQRIYKVT